jgi:rubrerythrin
MANDTGTRDATYNLISILYHALQGAETYGQYASDAGSDQDLANFFREVQQQEQQRADRAKELLAKRLQQGG